MGAQRLGERRRRPTRARSRFEQTLVEQLSEVARRHERPRAANAHGEAGESDEGAPRRRRRRAALLDAARRRSPSGVMSAGGLGLGRADDRSSTTRGAQHRGAGRSAQRRAAAARAHRGMSPRLARSPTSGYPAQDRALAADVLAHLDAQIASARSLLERRARAGRGDPRARRAHGRAPGGDPARGDGPPPAARGGALAPAGAQRRAARASRAEAGHAGAAEHADGRRAASSARARAAPSCAACCTSSSASTRATAR